MEQDADMTDVQPAGTSAHSIVPPGVWVDDSDEDDPVLRNADGTMVDTWREDYPYAERLGRDEYEHEKRLLQVELLKLQAGAAAMVFPALRGAPADGGRDRLVRSLVVQPGRGREGDGLLYRGTIRGILPPGA